MVSSKDESASDGEHNSGDMPESDSAVFTEGEKVLAYHGPRLYEAKVQKTELRKNEWRYFVHYLGWNKNWDEWVGTDRLMKYTEANLLKQQNLDRKQGVDKNIRSARLAPSKPKSSADSKADKEDVKSNAAKGKKRKADSSIEKDGAAAEKLLKIQIPLSLKKQLVDDWELVTQQNKETITLHTLLICEVEDKICASLLGQFGNDLIVITRLVKLPRCPTVDDILAKYLDYRSKKDLKIIDSVGEILKGIRCYFDKALPVLLLYKNERQQYKDTVLDSVSPSSIYGAEHLLRLFVKLPELITLVKLEEETLTGLQQNLLEFLKFLQKNQSMYFLGIYDGIKAPAGSGKV